MLLALVMYCLIAFISVMTDASKRVADTRYALLYFGIILSILLASALTPSVQIPPLTQPQTWVVLFILFGAIIFAFNIKASGRLWPRGTR
jgi:hypothetical protein